MNIVYDLKTGPNQWSEYVNSVIDAENPGYFLDNHRIGSYEWWSDYEDNKIQKYVQTGKIIFIGERADWSGHTAFIIEIESDGKNYEYEIQDDWNRAYLATGNLLEVEEFLIEFQGNNGPYSFGFIARITTTFL